MIPTKSTYQYLMVPTTVPLFNYMTSVSDFYATIWTRARHLQRLSMRQPKKTVTVRKWEPWTSFAICIVSPWLLTLAHFLVWILSPISMMTNRIRLSRHISAEPLPFSKKKKTNFTTWYKIKILETEITMGLNYSSLWSDPWNLKDHPRW